LNDRSGQQHRQRPLIVSESAYLRKIIFAEVIFVPESVISAALLPSES
jgi:hypothetical protein